MNKKILYLVLFFTLYITTISVAQTHNLKPNSICKYVKGKKNMEGMSACDACAEERKKNEAALEKEFKKRMADNEIAKAENLKKIQQDYIKRSEANRKAIEERSNNVVTLAPPKTETKVSQAPATTNTNTKAGYLYTAYRLHDLQVQDNYGSIYGYVLNAKGDSILKRNDIFYEFYGVSTHVNNKLDQSTFPQNTVITKLTTKARCKKYPEKNCLPVWDILNEKGERHFNDNTIVGILHISKNYFLLVFAPSDGSWSDNGYAIYEKAAIYNISDRSFFELEDKVTYKDGSYLEVSKQISQKPKLLFNEEQERKSWADNMAANNIKDYVVLKTGSHYPGKYAVYYISTNGKIAKKEFIYNDRVISELR